VPGATILIVEDNDDNVRIYSAILEHFGFAVVACRDGAEALSVARELQPSLILMDVALPSLDGWEATRRLKRDPTTAAIPIIALTALAYVEDEEMARTVGCDGYIRKPADPMSVAGAVQAMLRAAPPAN
jgi:two-component system cell cycle response regulator DivK